MKNKRKPRFHYGPEINLHLPNMLTIVSPQKETIIVRADMEQRPCIRLIVCATSNVRTYVANECRSNNFGKPEESEVITEGGRDLGDHLRARRMAVNRDSSFKNSVLSNIKKSSEKLEVSDRTNKKTDVASTNVVLNKKIVTYVDVKNTLKAKNVQADVHQDELCPTNKHDALMDSNKKINLDNPLCPNESKIMANILQNHPLRFSIAASSSVPWIYLGQFWHNLKEAG
uniref:Uncharacterized protein n=1 Tax=Tanacetum cinerariifolium TaxID=118510 RepID=A0A6L2KPY3_TANCI|nr:hypothetical protein [Tanacetum cinerariifolium]